MNGAEENNRWTIGILFGTELYENEGSNPITEEHGACRGKINNKFESY